MSSRETRVFPTVAAGSTQRKEGSDSQACAVRSAHLVHNDCRPRLSEIPPHSVNLVTRNVTGAEIYGQEACPADRCVAPTTLVIGHRLLDGDRDGSFYTILIVLLHHKVCRRIRLAIGAAQHGHRGNLLTRAAISRRSTAMGVGVSSAGRGRGSGGDETARDWRR